MTVSDELLQQSIMPLVKSIDRLEAQQSKFGEKLDQLPNLYVTRQEYTPNNTTLTALISAVSNQVGQLANQVEKNREKVEQTNTEGGKWILNEFDKIEQRINTKLDAQTKAAEDQFGTYKRDQSKAKQWFIGLIYGTASAATVGGVIAIIQHFWH